MFGNYDGDWKQGADWTYNVQNGYHPPSARQLYKKHIKLADDMYNDKLYDWQERFKARSEQEAWDACRLQVLEEERAFKAWQHADSLHKLGMSSEQAAIESGHAQWVNPHSGLRTILPTSRPYML